MEQFKKRKKVAAGFLLFLVFMWMCTLISKSVYASGLPRVTVKNPEKRYIEHIVEAEGIVRPGGELAMHVESGLRIQNIYVHTGDIIEEGTAVFLLDIEDLKEIIQAKELEIAEIDYQIADINYNRELQEQKKQLELARSVEDYEAAQRKSDQIIERANQTKEEAEAELQEHKDNRPDITSEEKREKAWDRYDKWVDKKKKLRKEVDEAALQLEKLERPNEDGSDKTQDQQDEITAARETLDNCSARLAEHERNEVSKPDFTAEDLEKEAWDKSRADLERAVEQAEFGQEDAQLNKEDSLKQEQRAIEDVMTAEQADSAIAIYQSKRLQQAQELLKYREILKQEGIVSSTMGGTITGIGVRVGERTPDAGAITCVDAGIPYQFSTVISKEQKRYVNQGDEVTLIFSAEGDRKKEITAQVDYLAESTVNPGTYEVVIYLPEGEGIVGMSGTLHRKYTGESQNICVPATALVREYQSTYVYVVAVREGILGEEFYAEKIAVSIKDENEKYAALEEGTLNGDSEIILTATEPYSKGSVIRYE